MARGNLPLGRITPITVNRKGKGKKPRQGVFGPPQQISPDRLPTTSQLVAQRMGNQLVAAKPRPTENIAIPDGSYSSMVPGPSYGKQYVMPEEQRVTEYEQPSWLETAASDAGEWITGAVGDAGEGIADAASYVAEKVGGFFSSLFGGGDEDEAKAKVAKKIKAKMQQRGNQSPDPRAAGIDAHNLRNAQVMAQQELLRNGPEASQLYSVPFDKDSPETSGLRRIVR